MESGVRLIYWFRGIIMSFSLVSSALESREQIPVLDVINYAAKKVVVAIDLKVQQLQTATIELQAAQKDLENDMEQTDLGDIIGSVQGEEQLYAEYYQELWKVKAAITEYERLAEMIAMEAEIGAQYKQISSAITQDGHFTAEEVVSMTGILSGILTASVNNMGQIQLVINAFVTQMPDAGRLRIIDAAAASVNKVYTDLQEFYMRSMVLSLNRARGSNDVSATRALWGIQ
jgi:hypothetical protein